ncbi:MAG: hypothetical protein HUJ76_00960 [Parasporobacterium sp.]|nr:hypothetical protein [Parasporobacterium sp.]
MKKIIASVVLAAMLCAALFTVAGAKGKGPMVVTTQSAYIEEGYEGDVWNGVCENVILSEDGTYVRTENTEIIHVSGNVVTYWTYTAWGEYEEVENDGETRVVVLKAPTDVEYVMNDALTTVDDDESLLEYFEEETIEINLETSKYAYAE